MVIYYIYLNQSNLIDNLVFYHTFAALSSIDREDGSEHFIKLPAVAIR